MSFETDLSNRLSKVDKNWDKDTLIRFLIAYLSPLFKRDLTYYMGSFDERYMMYLDGFPFKGPEVVCTSICRFYMDLFHEFKIKAVMIRTNNKIIPHNALKVLGNNGWYFIDPLKDLLANQYGMKPSFYGNCPCREKYNSVVKRNPELISLSQFYVRNIDETIGLKRGPYTDEIVADASELFKRYNSWFWKDKSLSGQTYFEKRLYALSELFLNIGEVNGVYERMQLLDYLIASLFNKKERSKIETSIVKSEDDMFYVELQSFVDDYRREYIEKKTNTGYKLILKS